jgi:hypothetical protein
MGPDPDGRDRERRKGQVVTAGIGPGSSRYAEGNWQPAGYIEPRWRSRCAQVLFGLAAAVTAYEAVLAAQGSSFTRALANHDYVSPRDVATWADNVDAAGGVYVCVTIALAVCFIAWLYRTVANVPALGGGTASQSPRWAAIWWFVPIAFLWMPYTVVRESWERLATPDHNGQGKLVLAWWLCFIGGTLIARATNAFANDPSASYSTLQTLYADEMLGFGILATSAVLGLLIVRRMDERARWRTFALARPMPEPARWGSEGSVFPTSSRIALCTNCATRAADGDVRCAICGSTLRVIVGESSGSQL